MRLIPSLDVLGGRVVRLRQGDPAAATFYAATVAELVARFSEAGVERVHLVDLDGAFGHRRQTALLNLASAFPQVRFQIGGGLRSREAVETVLAAGMAPVVGTLALERPDLLNHLLDGLTAGEVIAALDLRGGELQCRGWTAGAKIELEMAVNALRDLGVQTALVTAVERDGMGAGPDLAVTARVARLGLQVQASGGVRSLTDVADLARISGVVAAVSGRAVLEGAIDLAAPESQSLLRDGAP